MCVICVCMRLKRGVNKLPLSHITHIQTYQWQSCIKINCPSTPMSVYLSTLNEGSTALRSQRCEDLEAY